MLFVVTSMCSYVAAIHPSVGMSHHSDSASSVINRSHSSCFRKSIDSGGETRFNMGPEASLWEILPVIISINS